MLYKDPFIIAPETFKLCQELQELPELANFFLVGGTSLALQLGHRNSIDIDLFTRDEFNNQLLIDFLNTKYVFVQFYSRPNTIIGSINGIKVDFIRHDYPFVLPPLHEEGIRYLSKEDIAAMKINAFIWSSKRLKDFIDIYYLLEHYSIEKMLEFFTLKYPHTNHLIALKSISYFEELDPNIDPPKLKTPLPIDLIKERILDAVLHSKKTY